MTFDNSKQYSDFADLIAELSDEEKNAIAIVPTDYTILNEDSETYRKITISAHTRWYIDYKEKNGSVSDEVYQHYENLFHYLAKLQTIKRVAHMAQIAKSKYYSSINRYGPTVQGTLKDYIGEEISEKPIYVIADHINKQIKEATLATKTNSETKDEYQDVQFGDVVLDAYPDRMIITRDPLEELTKYTISFRTNKDTNLELGPLSLAEMTKELLEKTSLVYKPRVLKERLNAIINAYIAHKKVEYRTEIEREGFFWIDGKLQMSKVACMKDAKPITHEEALDAINFIAETKQRFYFSSAQITRLAHQMKWAVAAPYDFARRQAGFASKANNYLPRQDLYGETDSGKTNGTKYITLGMYGLQEDEEYNPPYGACDTQPRFINKTGKSTFPVIIDEADELTHWNKERHAERMLSLLKNQTTMTAPRQTLTKESDEIVGYSLSAYILTHNSDRIDEDGFLKRVTSIGFTTADKKNELQIKQFEQFMQKNIHRYLTVGKFAIGYVMQNQEILKEKWSVMADKILDALYQLAEVEKPQWLSELVTNTIKEDLQTHRRGLVRQLLVNYINDSYLKNRYSIEESLSGAGRIDPSDMIAKLQALLSINALPDFHLRGSELMILSSIKTQLEKANLDRISGLKALAELCGFTYKDQKKVNGHNIPVALADLTEFAAFLAIRIDETETDSGQAALPIQYTS